MFLYRDLPVIIGFLRTWSIIFLINTVWKNGVNRSTFVKYGTILIFILSVITIIWLLVNKELFHWNYDIATGKPVDHYSSYGKCMARAVYACVTSAISMLLSYFQKRNKK